MNSSLNPVELRELIEEFHADRKTLKPLYPAKGSKRRHLRFKKLYLDWLARLEPIPFESLTQTGKAEFLLLKRYLEHQIRLGDLANAQAEAATAFAPFVEEIFELEEALIRMELVEARGCANSLDRLLGEVAAAQQRMLAPPMPEAHRAGEAVALVLEAQESLQRWNSFYDGYDPVFTWWMAQPLKALDVALEQFVRSVREEVIGIKAEDDSAIIGSPAGRERLAKDLAYEQIPYSPEELLRIAERELRWCDEQMLAASEQLGFGQDWTAAQDHVKNMHVDPGKQPEVVRGLALEAIQYLEDRDLITIPELAKESIYMEMMSPERQRVNPFFLGGKRIIVSYPTQSMTHSEKLMSMRGNSAPFSRATVQHELIPGHHMQWFMSARHKPYRKLFHTPFWTEGWALYWEMLLWDLGFPRTPEERIGMLIWRRHRCVRVVFSLKFHLEEMDANECIDMLVERVGHERANAEGEVRRSFSAGYPPLYQLAYLIGGLQFRALRKEAVEDGKMTARQFHDAVMQENCMPPYMLRAILLNQELPPDYLPKWRFAD